MTTVMEEYRLPAEAIPPGGGISSAGRLGWNSASVEQDGRLLLSASADHTVTLWSLCDFTPTRTFVFSKAPSHAIPLEPEDFAFVAAVGDSLERVPLTEQMLPLAADRGAMDAAQLLMTREALRN